MYVKFAKDRGERWKKGGVKQKELAGITLEFKGHYIVYTRKCIYTQNVKCTNQLSSGGKIYLPPVTTMDGTLMTAKGMEEGEGKEKCSRRGEKGEDGMEGKRLTLMSSWSS